MRIPATPSGRCTARRRRSRRRSASSRTSACRTSSSRSRAPRRPRCSRASTGSHGRSSPLVHELDFGYVGLGAHEELVLSVAEALGFYAEEGVRVRVCDATAWDDERLRSAAIVGLGRTVLLRLRFGVPWTGVCVNTEHPMFWLMARSEFADV